MPRRTLGNYQLRGGQQIGKAFLNIQAANSHSEMGLIGNSQRAAGNGSCPIEFSRVDSIGNYCHSPGI
jgi:hypothetical protein